jgi:hypothetical protein
VPQQVGAQTGAPSGEVRPDVGPPGTTFAFFATGFEGGEEDGDEDEDEKEIVSVWINRPDTSTTTDGIIELNNVTDTGRADWKWIAPEDAQPGIWSAVAFGNDSGHEVVITFEIRPGAEQPAPDPERLDSNVQPNAGPGGTTFSFYATGFDGEEEIGIWLNTPDGRVLDAETDELYQATPSGRADWEWTAPVNAQPGMWSMVARGKESGVERVLIFELVP